MSASTTVFNTAISDQTSLASTRRDYRIHQKVVEIFRPAMTTSSAILSPTNCK